jgi:beta-glucanase (GH16 family)
MFVKNNLPALLICLVGIFFSCKDKELTPPPVNNPTPVIQYWEFESTPVWQDEFSVNGSPDAAKWGYDVGGDGWGNNELQYYTNGNNAAVNNGILKIEARKENFSGRLYTSSRMVTKGKGDWLFGRFEIKAKLPKGRGTWPAIWMLPTDWVYGGWPNSGEIDIMEHVGFDQNKVHITIHTKALNHTLNTQRGAYRIVPTASDEFHVYRLDWASYGIRGYIDGDLVFEYTNPNTNSDYWPFDKRFHLLLNIAIGGSWGGQQGVDDTIFPATMEIDYVKVFKYIK